MQLLKQGGVNFAILGTEETCTGDPARRGCNEYLFQTLAAQNVETLNGYGMNGSGLFIINPPWSLEKTLRETLPKLTEILAQGEGAQFRLESEST